MDEYSEYSKDAPEKSAAVRRELDRTYHTFEEILHKVDLEEQTDAGAGIGSEISPELPSNIFAANSESTSRPGSPTINTSSVCALS